MNHKKRLLTTIAIDLIAFLLLSFYVCAMSFGFFGKNEGTPSVALQTPAPETAAPVSGPENPEDTPTPDGVAAPPQDGNLLGGRFAEKFLGSGEAVIDTETLYRSQDVCVELTYAEEGKVRYQVADIYIKNIESLRAHAAVSSKDKGHTPRFARQVSAITAINGDYFMNAKTNKHGWFVRDGQELGRFDKLYEDICVIYYDGTMETFDVKQGIDVDAIYARYPWQVFYFGPALLSADGSMKSEFNSYALIAGKANPRTVIGYYEPGHYAFILVQGTRTVRDENGKVLYQRGPSAGMSAAELSVLCHSLGLKAAYNLDGGGSSTMMFYGKAFGHNSRDTSDIVYIAEVI